MFPIEIDLRDARKLASVALDELRDLDGLQPDPGNTTRKADAKRSLLYAADTLDRAAAEVRAQYHAINGYPDPLPVRRDLP